jgi:hypothetical protein
MKVIHLSVEQLVVNLIQIFWDCDIVTPKKEIYSSRAFDVDDGSEPSSIYHMIIDNL